MAIISSHLPWKTCVFSLDGIKLFVHMLYFVDNLFYVFTIHIVQFMVHSLNVLLVGHF